MDGHRTAQTGMWRSRWAAIGAAVAVTLGGGTGLLTVAAAGEPSVLVNVTPTRVLDTRINIGLNGANATGVGRLLDVTGTIPIVLPGDTPGSALVIPDNATAIVANLTAVAPTAPGFVSIRPGDATGNPTTSNINIGTPGGATPNAITVPIHTDGTVNLFYFGNTPGATTHLLLDIVGYYQPGGTGTPGPAGPPGPRPQQLVWVAKSGGDFTSVASAMASITDATANKPYVIKIAPGEYVEPGGVTLKSNVSIEGSGPESTTVSCACIGTPGTATAATLRVVAPGAGRIDGVTIANTSNANSTALALFIHDAGTSPVHITDVHLWVTANPGGGTGMFSEDSTVVGDEVDVRVTATVADGIFVTRGQVSLSDLSLIVAGGVLASGATMIDGTGHSLRDVYVQTSVFPGGSASGLSLGGDASVDTATVSVGPGNSSIGIVVSGLASATIKNTTVSASSIGVDAAGLGGVVITESFITGAVSVRRPTIFPPAVRIANTRLNGDTSGTPTCFDVYTMSFTPYTCV